MGTLIGFAKHLRRESIHEQFLTSKSGCDQVQAVTNPCNSSILLAYPRYINVRKIVAVSSTLQLVIGYGPTRRCTPKSVVDVHYR